MIRLYKHFAGHIVLMSIIGLMFIFKSWLGSTLFGLSFALLRDIGCILTAYIFTLLSALYFGAGRRASPRGGTLIN
jgi:F-type H+-transporting ATPase subunit a